jgi:hypothetical protein
MGPIGTAFSCAKDGAANVLRVMTFGNFSADNLGPLGLETLLLSMFSS